MFFHHSIHQWIDNCSSQMRPLLFFEQEHVAWMKLIWWPQHCREWSRTKFNSRFFEQKVVHKSNDIKQNKILDTLNTRRKNLFVRVFCLTNSSFNAQLSKSLTLLHSSWMPYCSEIRFKIEWLLSTDVFPCS